ncbi:MAG: DUF2892 domain-containing protein [Anaerolineae bacterium]|nr:DUF2892 domain-containing protein [Thermoflexales bacterium]MDW8394689.1 DUF2892 domain-containing protein [Anaerolineae bacterium]
MVKNMGTIDRVVRTVAAVVIAALIVTGTLQGTLAVVLGVVAVMFLLTSLVGVCPAYLPFRINTGARK